MTAIIKQPFLSMPKEFKYEFLKLDEIDLKVASWVYEHHPKALRAYLQYLSNEYYPFDVEKAYEELIKFYTLE